MSRQCPIAHAFLRQFKLGNVMVTQVCVWDLDNPKGWNLPREATNFIKRFDGGLPVAPITFQVDDSRIQV